MDVSRGWRINELQSQIKSCSKWSKYKAFEIYGELGTEERPNGSADKDWSEKSDESSEMQEYQFPKIFMTGNQQPKKNKHKISPKSQFRLKATY